MIQITLNFATALEAAAALALLSGKAPAAATPASTKPTVAAAAATETTKASADAPAAKELDWDKDVIPALQALSKRDMAAFKKLLAAHGVEKVPPLKLKPDTWAALLAGCAT